MTRTPTVTVAIPVLNEERHIEACLDAVAAQTCAQVVEILVVDGGSTDDTRRLATGRPGVRVLHNPRRIQAAALNIALAAAAGDVFVRVDGHCIIAADYVGRSVAALQETGASMVGGAMRPVAITRSERGIAAAMSSALGAGPARFHVGGAAAWVDTVYLGAFETKVARQVGGYAEDVGVNEDAEFAVRMSTRGGVWFDPEIRSTYAPRSDLAGVVRQFYRYGRSRAATVRKHPSSLAVRQLAAPLLVVALASPWRRPAAAAYLGLIGARGLAELARDPGASIPLTLALPAMHLSWGVGFMQGLVSAHVPARVRPTAPVGEAKASHAAG